MTSPSWRARTLAVAVLAALALGGCASVPPQIRSTTTSFVGPGFKIAGTVAVMSADAAQNVSLEFAYYRGLIADKLAAAGYAVVDDVAKADQVAIVSYGIDNGRAELYSVPVYGQIGGWPTYTTGVVTSGPRQGTFAGSTYFMPQFGIVGTTSESAIVYTRALALDIVDGPSFRANATRKLLEMRTKSEGSCSTMPVLLPTLVDAAFAIFPGESGKPRTDVRSSPQGFIC